MDAAQMRVYPHLGHFIYLLEKGAVTHRISNYTDTVERADILIIRAGFCADLFSQ
jgi:hypothetical protein